VRTRNFAPLAPSAVDELSDFVSQTPANQGMFLMDRLFVVLGQWAGRAFSATLLIIMFLWLIRSGLEKSRRKPFGDQLEEHEQRRHQAAGDGFSGHRTLRRVIEYLGNVNAPNLDSSVEDPPDRSRRLSN